MKTSNKRATNVLFETSRWCSNRGYHLLCLRLKTSDSRLWLYRQPYQSIRCSNSRRVCWSFVMNKNFGTTNDWRKRFLSKNSRVSKKRFLFYELIVFSEKSSLRIDHKLRLHFYSKKLYGHNCKTSSIIVAYANCYTIFTHFRQFTFCLSFKIIH